MATFSPDGAKVATASRDGKVRIFDRNGKLEKTLLGHMADILFVDWAEGGRTLVTSSDDGTVKRWGTESGSLIQTFDMGAIETDTIAVTPSGAVFAGDEGWFR